MHSSCLSLHPAQSQCGSSLACGLSLVMQGGVLGVTLTQDMPHSHQLLHTPHHPHPHLPLQLLSLPVLPHLLLWLSPCQYGYYCGVSVSRREAQGSPTLPRHTQASLSPGCQHDIVQCPASVLAITCMGACTCHSEQLVNPSLATSTGPIVQCVLGQGVTLPVIWTS